ncbi:MAG: DUF808 domain-containing protein [Actinobacteria bacterium]|nr:DUF808 domain-containing protein [Actinomycetota bacterium]
MAGGLVGLLDDIAALAKMAAASLDDAAAAATKAGAKTVGVVVDDAAVTPAYVQGLAANRELPIIKKIAIGSLRNKMLIILPVAMFLSSFDFGHTIIEIILICGGSFLAYEGAHKILHRLSGHHEEHEDEPAVTQGVDEETAVISSAVRTDLILSAEIMVIALKDALDNPFFTRLLVMIIVALFITLLVYGVVALIVKMDDIGLSMVRKERSTTQVKLGRGLVNGMPKVLTTLTVVGTAAMLWVGGHILLVSTKELGWTAPYDLVHRIEKPFHDVSGVGGALGWTANTVCSAILGLLVGVVIAKVVEAVHKLRNPTTAAAH